MQFNYESSRHKKQASPNEHRHRAGNYASLTPNRTVSSLDSTSSAARDIDSILNGYLDDGKRKASNRERKSRKSKHGKSLQSSARLFVKLLAGHSFQWQRIYRRKQRSGQRQVRVKETETQLEHQRLRRNDQQKLGCRCAADKSSYV